MRFHISHCRDPLLQQQILKPRGCESFQAVPHLVVVLRLRNAAAIAKRTYNLVEYSGLRWQHLIYAANKKWAVLLRQYWRVFSWQTEALCRSVVIHIANRRHSSQPFAQIALV